MLKRAKRILKNEQGIEAIEIVGMGLIAMICVALIFHSVKDGATSTTNKTKSAMDAISDLKTSSGADEISTAINN